MGVGVCTHQLCLSISVREEKVEFLVGLSEVRRGRN